MKLENKLEKLNYRVCNRCVMDTTAANIYFNTIGNCNYCEDFLNIKRLYNFDGTKKKILLNELIQKIKDDGKNKKYDCIVGVSGGVDSSYVLYLVNKYGLKPLAVHMDNGWNSELAQNNISNLVKKLNIDLYTHVIDWEEYKNMMLAFFKSDTIDVELLYDNAMLAVNYQAAEKYKLKYILSGTNTSTEGIKVPSNWSWFKNDALNIADITKRFSNQKIKTFPLFGTKEFIRYEILKKIKWLPFLDYFSYQKDDAIQILKKEFSFKPYPYKHYESIFTRFYQGYILPKKFGVDKRKLHLSNLIMTKQITREKAKILLQQPCYPDENQEKHDLKFFLKKMGWVIDDLQNYLNRPEISHDFYRSELKTWNKLKKVYLILKNAKKKLL